MKEVIHVNQNDKVVGHGAINQAFRKGLAVRIVRIFIANSSGQLLLQKRSATITSSPLKWDQSAAGHVDKNETYIKAAKRELEEEMGIKNVSLKRINKFYTEDKYDSDIRRRFNVLYYGVYNGKVSIDNDEVEDYKWIDLKQLEEWLTKNPEDFTSDLTLTLGKLKSYLS